MSELASFNALPREEAERRLYTCFAHRGWARKMAARRPYDDMSDLSAAADQEWSVLAGADWLAAFASHPRIGEAGGDTPRVSAGEQRAIMQAPAGTLATLAEENRHYEARFGHVFLIAAKGRTADQILHELRRRMGNDPAVELQEAAAEQRAITRLRMAELK